MKSSFAFATPVMVAITAAVGTLANAHTNMHGSRDAVSGAPAMMPKVGSFTSQGCYSTAPNMTDANVSSAFLSIGSCVKACIAGNYAVSAISPQNCYCGNTYPPKDSSVDLSKCNSPCNGFATDACGGTKDAYSIYNNGINLAPENYGDSSSSPSASSSTSSAKTSPSTSAAANSTITSPSTSAAASAAPTESKVSPTPPKSNVANTASTAVSVIIGAVVAAAIIGGI